ncbi:MAG: hypothetical protein CM15mP129_07240 [Chloroflexota bacterium]|nr:MAG: hypothetical protein CM15mP129_07240 [Chloroflexota bacterium]
MGFGHRVYKAEDPRASQLQEGVKFLSQEKGDPSWYEILVAVMDAMKPYQRRGFMLMSISLQESFIIF